MKIEEIKQRIDIEQYIKSHGVALKKHGQKDLVGHCPFHKDDTPSLIVTPSKQLFNCPGCNTGGSVIDFAMKIHSLDLKGAISLLKSDLKTGESGNHSEPLVTQNQIHKNETKSPELPVEKRAELLEKTVSFYAKKFLNSMTGTRYLESRGITDAGLFEKHRIGFADGTLIKALPKEGQILEELRSLGVLCKDDKSGNYYERFKDCVVFPVCDEEGNFTTLYGRYTKAGNKRHVYLPGASKGLFNLSCIKTFPEVYLVESVIDALSLEMAGFPNVISVQSATTKLDTTPLKNNGVTALNLAFDGDKAGQDAAKELQETLTAFSVKVCDLPSGEDPNSLLLKDKENIRLHLSTFTSPKKSEAKTAQNENENETKSPESFSVVYGPRTYQVSAIDKTIKNLRAMIRIEHNGKLHIDTIDFYSAQSRKKLHADLTRLFSAIPEEIEQDISKLLRQCESHVGLKKSSENEAKRGMELTAEDKATAEALGKSPDLIGEIGRAYEKCGLIGEKYNKLLSYLAVTSRKMDQPLSIFTLSSSGAGKTALQDAAVNFCPPEDLVKVTSLSEKALNYMGEGNLKHKVLALEEGAGAEDASYAIRNLISSGVLTTQVAGRDPKTGKLRTDSHKTEGPTAVLVTSTQPDTDAETKSRFIIMGIDESKEQTRKILEFQRKRHTLDGLKEDTEAKETVHVHRNFQRLLKSVKVVNPLADRLTYSDDRLQSRRAQPQYLNLIKAIAFLRQMQKPTLKHGEINYIEVDEIDLDIGNKLATEILGKSLDELSIPARNLLNNLHQMLAAKREKLLEGNPKQEKNLKISQLKFNRREARDYTGWSKTRLQIHLKELLELEYAILDSGNRNMLQHYRLLYDGEGEDGEKFLPGLKKE